MFEITTSAFSASCRAIACPSGRERFSGIPRLPRALMMYWRPSPGMIELLNRVASPSTGSTLITSAPPCANISAAYGPATNTPNSTTFSPSNSGSDASVIVSDSNRIGGAARSWRFLGHGRP
jgi:hypothetical protein